MLMIHHHVGIGSLTFSSDSNLLAAVVVGDVVPGPDARMWLLSAPSWQPGMSLDPADKRAFSASHDATFINPLLRMVLFQGSCNNGVRQGYVLHHVPALCADGKYRQQHSHAPWTGFIPEEIDPQECSLRNSLTLDSDSLSADGSLFVIVGSAGSRARCPLLKHWWLDYKGKTCDQKSICRLDLTSGSRGLHGLALWG